MLTAHVPVPEHAPLHPANPGPVAGVALNLTLVPLSTGALHIQGKTSTQTKPEGWPAPYVIVRTERPLSVPPPPLVTLSLGFADSWRPERRRG